MLPLEAVHMEDDGLVAELPKDAIKKAPQVDARQELTEADQETLLNFYNAIFRAQGTHDTQAGSPEGSNTEETDAKSDTGHDSSGPTTDTAMTRSEEQLHVDKHQREHAHLRLKKYIVTEHQTVTLPLKKEKLHIEREPITDTNRDAAMEGPRLSEEAHDMVLREEVPDITQETMPVERVRMTKDTEERMHNEDRKIRKEQIGVEKIEPDKGSR